MKNAKLKNSGSCALEKLQRDWKTVSAFLTSRGVAEAVAAANLSAANDAGKADAELE